MEVEGRDCEYFHYQVRFFIYQSSGCFGRYKHYQITKKPERYHSRNEATIKMKSNDNYAHQATQPKILLANEIRQKSCPLLINHTPVPIYLSEKGHPTK